MPNLNWADLSMQVDFLHQTDEHTYWQIFLRNATIVNKHKSISFRVPLRKQNTPLTFILSSLLCNICPTGPSVLLCSLKQGCKWITNSPVCYASTIYGCAEWHQRSIQFSIILDITVSFNSTCYWYCGWKWKGNSNGQENMKLIESLKVVYKRFL